MIIDPELLRVLTEQRREDLRRAMLRCRAVRAAAEGPEPGDHGVVLPFQAARRES